MMAMTNPPSSSMPLFLASKSDSVLFNMSVRVVTMHVPVWSVFMIAFRRALLEFLHTKCAFRRVSATWDGLQDCSRMAVSCCRRSASVMEVENPSPATVSDFVFNTPSATAFMDESRSHAYPWVLLDPQLATKPSQLSIWTSHCPEEVIFWFAVHLVFNMVSVMEVMLLLATVSWFPMGGVVHLALGRRPQVLVTGPSVLGPED